jgi:quercetin dioxygenase-like cupin family protein
MTELSLQLIGPRLKSWRQKRNLTLDELSELTDISPSTIARALRLELDDLVPRTVPDPRVPGVTKHVGDRTFVELSPEASPTQASKMTIPPSPPGTVIDPRVHDGYEWLYVLSGRLRLVLGEHDLVMGPGEAAEFDTRTPHWVGSAGPGSVEVLAIFSKQGKRIHMRARPASA